MFPDSSRPSGPDIDDNLTILTAAEGSGEVLLLPSGQFKVTVKPHDTHAFIPRASCETSLPLDVIAAFLETSFVWLCDSLARHDDPEYVKRVLEKQLLAYVGASGFRGKRLLDFGCGSGASTLCLGAILPDTEVVGVERTHAILTSLAGCLPCGRSRMSSSWSLRTRIACSKSAQVSHTPDNRTPPAFDFICGPSTTSCAYSGGTTSYLFQTYIFQANWYPYSYYQRIEVLDSTFSINYFGDNLVATNGSYSLGLTNSGTSGYITLGTELYDPNGPTLALLVSNCP
jgi:hypothetical protein